MKVTAKRLTILVALGSLVVLGLLFVAAREQIAERWYLYQLESGDREAAIAAAEWLVERESEQVARSSWSVFVRALSKRELSRLANTTAFFKSERG